MTRYARAGKGTHQRVAKDSTPWDEMKPPEPQRVRGAEDKPRGRKQFPKKRKERFSKGGDLASEKTPDLKEVGEKPTKPISKGFKKGRAPITRGFGDSKSVKIFGQFWVPFEDGKRLKNLSQKLKAQGLPRKEIIEVLKNERRKAEKAAKRQRDKTCFQCRQFGHVLSDCPNLRKAIAGDGNENGGSEGVDSVSGLGEICFKCGSTEHTSRNCKRKGEKFTYANCFICCGTGHIARQCPKNSNGIYPSGGSCSECGSTAHLQKDCPDLAGIEKGPVNNKSDDDGITLRMSDPFSSTEYEPVFDFDDTINKKNNNQPEVVHEQADEPVFVVQNKKSKPETKKKTVKRKTDEQISANLLRISETVVPAKKPLLQPLFSNTKRKVVKF